MNDEKKVMVDEVKNLKFALEAVNDALKCERQQKLIDSKNQGKSAKR